MNLDEPRRSYAQITQGSMFGVTDVYFVAGYYGLMDVIIGHVAKLSRHRMHLKDDLPDVECEAILKTVGVRGSSEVDRILGITELVGFWVNGDPLLPCISNGLFVSASNFGGYSIAPAIGPSVEAILWFVDYPEDFEIIRQDLPVHNDSTNRIVNNALYVYGADHGQTIRRPRPL